jgi:hypothetical protein
VDRIKIIATLKWVHDILRELHFTDVLEDIDDCIMMLKKEQREAVQHQWVGLTDEQLSETYNDLYTQYTRDDVNIADFILIARTIESTLREKNGG